MKNRFEIDLDVLDLTDEQRAEIASALQKATTSVLANFFPAKELKLIPLDSKELGEGFGGRLGYVGRF